MRRVIGVLLLVLATTGSVYAQTYRLIPSADAHVVDGSEAGTNFGTAPLMEVFGNNPSKWAYVKFDTTPVQGVIRSAWLYVWVWQAGGTPGSINLHAAPVTWDEPTITWNNKPNPDAQLAVFSLPSIGQWHIATINVTDQVRAALATGQWGFVARPSSNNRLFYIPARESVDALGWQWGQSLLDIYIDSPPIVSITSPANGANFAAPANFTLSASASDPDLGPVTRVDFYRDGIPIGTDTSEPFEATVTDLPSGTYSFTAVATDDEGAQTTSAPVAVTVGGALASALYFIDVDHLNTPRAVSNQSGQEVWRWDQQEPFGINVPDENPSGLGTFDLPLRLPGQYFDKETNLHYNYYRDYDPAIGRYVRSDPIGLRGGINTYSYVASNPLLLTDGLGLQAVLPAPFPGPGGAAWWSGRNKPRDPSGFRDELFPEAGRNPGVRWPEWLRPWMTSDATEEETTSDTPRERGLPPAGVKPPIPDADKCIPGPASRPSEREKGGKSLWDPRGGEWRHFPGDRWHNPHWDYNPHDRPSSPWQNVPIGDLPPVKPKP